MARKQTSEKEVAVSNGAAAAPVRRKVATPPRSKHAAKGEVAVASPLNADIAETVGAAAIANRTEPTYEQIAKLAYSYWEARGCRGGSPEEDWVRAEQELRSR